MSTYPTPKTWTAVVVTVPDLNTYVSDAFNALHPNVLSKSADYTIATSDGHFVVVKMDASGANRTVNLYTAVGNSGAIMVVKKTDSSANTVTIDANSTETSDGALTQSLPLQYDEMTLVSDGANWIIASRVGTLNTVNLQGGQIAFPAAQNASSGANTLDDYEETASWTPADGSGAGLTFTSVVGHAVKIGQMVFAFFTFTYPSTASGAAAIISGFPYTAKTSSALGAAALGLSNYSAADATLQMDSGATTARFLNTSGGNLTNTDLSTRTFTGVMIYRASA